MPRLWWVNHKQTVRQEVDGQYLWSPKTKNNGRPSEFYDNMRRADPGDLVLSYANQKVGHVGRVADFAFTAPKPEEFGSAGAYWNSEGWYLPTFWVRLDPPVRPKPLIDRLRRFLPSRYSPINLKSGDGNQGAYLSEIERTVFEIIVAGSTYDHIALARGGANSLTFQVVSEMLDDVVERGIMADLTLDDTEKDTLI